VLDDFGRQAHQITNKTDPVANLAPGVVDFSLLTPFLTKEDRGHKAEDSPIKDKDLRVEALLTKVKDPQVEALLTKVKAPRAEGLEIKATASIWDKEMGLETKAEDLQIKVKDLQIKVKDFQIKDKDFQIKDKDFQIKDKDSVIIKIILDWEVERIFSTTMEYHHRITTITTTSLAVLD
jgi:hypothetical protein